MCTSEIIILKKECGQIGWECPTAGVLPVHVPVHALDGQEDAILHWLSGPNGI